MPEGLRLRAATAEDAEILFQWRNDVLTRMASRHSEIVDHAGHVRWLADSLRDPARRLLIVEEDGVPVGTVRADMIDGIHELSWTVAPGARGHGVGKRMVALFASQFEGVVRAEVKKENAASARIAVYAGMTLTGEENGMLQFIRADAKRPASE